MVTSLIQIIVLAPLGGMCASMSKVSSILVLIGLLELYLSLSPSSLLLPYNLNSKILQSTIIFSHLTLNSKIIGHPLLVIPSWLLLRLLVVALHPKFGFRVYHVICIITSMYYFCVKKEHDTYFFTCVENLRYVKWRLQVSEAFDSQCITPPPLSLTYQAICN